MPQWWHQKFVEEHQLQLQACVNCRHARQAAPIRTVVLQALDACQQLEALLSAIIITIPFVFVLLLSFVGEVG